MAVSCVGETTVVERVDPFHSTVLPFTNPAPLTVRVKSLPVADVAVGDKEFATGAGFRFAAVAMLLVNKKISFVGEGTFVAARYANPFVPHRTSWVPVALGIEVLLVNVSDPVRAAEALSKAWMVVP